jgi:hypothetical protein
MEFRRKGDIAYDLRHSFVGNRRPKKHALAQRLRKLIGIGNAPDAV